MGTFCTAGGIHVRRERTGKKALDRGQTRIERARRPLRGLGSQAPAAAESPRSGLHTSQVPTPSVTCCDGREAIGTPEEAPLGGIWVGDRQGGAIGRDRGHGGAGVMSTYFGGRRRRISPFHGRFTLVLCFLYNPRPLLQPSLVYCPPALPQPSSVRTRSMYEEVCLICGRPVLADG